MQRLIPTRLLITAVLAFALAAVCGLLSPPPPAHAYAFPTWESIATGANHSCVLRTDGYVQCWGSNSDGQLGDGTNDPRTFPSRLVKVSTGGFLTGAVSIAAGAGRTCALLDDKRVMCWGWGQSGALGNGTTEDSNTAVFVSGLTGAVAVGTGRGYHVCAVLANGSARCWGNNAYGELGDGSTDGYSTTPVPVSDLTRAVEVTAGGNYTCARKSNGTVWCWGRNQMGQLGDGTTTGSLTPVQVLGISNAIAITAGNSHTCAVLSGKRVKCWGWNKQGQLGATTTETCYFVNPCSTTPVFVTDLGGAVAVGAGQNHSCARLGNKKIKCWGGGGFGQLGNGTNDDSTTPVTVEVKGAPPGTPLEGGIALSVGSQHNCALTLPLKYYCWGLNSGGSGQLGDGTTEDQNRAVEVLNPQYARLPSLTAGGYTSCAGLGGAMCWGDNAFGQVGDGTLEDRLSPVPVTDLIEASVISGGEYHTCAIADAGAVECWGLNGNGQLGDGSTTDSSTPVTVIETGATGVAAGGYHTCATSNGYVDCWGKNNHGQLGDGSTVESTAPVPVVLVPGEEPTLLTDVVTVVAGDEHACALLSDGTVMCWGNNNSGQLGDGTGADSDLPVFVLSAPSAPPLAGVIAITAGRHHTCALLDDGSAMCWGSNEFGQLGDGQACGMSCQTPTPVVGAVPGASVGTHTSLALDASGNPVVSYRDLTNGDLKVMHCNDPNCAGGDESITWPDTVGDAGWDTALVLDASGNPVVSYYDVTNGDLKVLHCNDPDCAGGDESITSPDTSGDVGKFASLALDASGNPVVSYYDEYPNKDLKVMHCNDADCAGGDESITSPDTVGDVGVYSSLALDASGNPVVSYVDFGNAVLKVLHCNDPNCTGGDDSITSPDTSGNVGGQTSLTLDASGNPVVAYLDHNNWDLKVLHCDDPDCAGDESPNIASPDTAGDVGVDTALVLDTSGNPVVSYLDYTNWDLKVLHCGDPNCTSGNSVTSPDTTGSVGDYSSLALDASGNPVVSYYDFSNDDLKVMHCNDPDCAGGDESIASPDTGGSLYTAIEAGGEHTCAVKSDGKVHCWGHNDHGQPVNGTTTDSTTPIAMSLLPDEYVVTLAAGGPSHTCVVLGSGVIKCAGQNDSGQLGDGTTTERTNLVGTGLDTDNDGCADSEEREGAPPPKPGSTGDYSQLAWYDFYDVPVPARPDSTPNGTKDQAVTMSDVLAVLFYVGTYDGGPPNANGVAYDSDKGVDTDGDTVVDIAADGVPDGRGYDRSPGPEPNPPWDAGPPSGAVSMGDVLAVLAQVGLSCIDPP